MRLLRREKGDERRVDPFPICGASRKQRVVLWEMTGRQAPVPARHSRGAAPALRLTSLPMPTRPDLRAHFSMIRGFQLADAFTLGNAACGVAAVLMAMRYALDRDVGNLLVAAALAPAALIFDILDGRVARWRGTSSALGRELDSLADVISFGVAPAALAYACGMTGLWDGAVLVYFVCCGVSRLARYNVTAEAMSEGGDKVKYFEGTPIPTSVLLVGLLTLAAYLDAVQGKLWFGVTEIAVLQLHPLVLLFALSGSLMISRIRIPKL